MLYVLEENEVIRHFNLIFINDGQILTIVNIWEQSFIEIKLPTSPGSQIEYQINDSYFISFRVVRLKECWFLYVNIDLDPIFLRQNDEGKKGMYRFCIKG
jgi:hypothetical protein